MALSSETLSEFKSLALSLAPELRQSPLYCLNHPDCLPPVQAVGYVICDRCAPLEKHLQDTGEWKGHGPKIVFARPDLSHDAAAVVLLHELAHILNYEPPASVADGESSEEDFTVDLELFSSWAKQPEPPSGTEPAWAIGGHHKNFHRTAIHLWWRAALAGTVIDGIDSLCGGFWFDLSPGFFYWRSIGNEGVLMKDKLFSEILATKPPKRFSQLWYGDLGEWMKRNPSAVAYHQDRGVA